ncbi:MAG: hypothetical protein SAJ12_02600 [Jaaginema sp. PMC 1079.18]|nr:hypothetical protein [Jaaginema sp. PMC 1080.18]MEC4849879.1 hypothetical protein [Jaaginema sp. PMC 1079.18]MEC4866868.1 hypothetical protein [Jaaginema sp. PMC 1078.18]
MMNSDNEQNPDILYQQLLHWLQNPETEATNVEASVIPPHQGQTHNPVDPVDSMIEWHTPEFSDTASGFDAQSEDPLIWEIDELDLDRDEEESASAQSIQSFDVGDTPIVQKRFQALLKRKLQAEIERHPPLFPWETEMADYQLEYADAITTASSASRQTWMPQLAGVLPIAIPDNLLSQLLDRCSDRGVSFESPIAQLMNAVKPLFPERLSELNTIANRIRLSPSFATSRLSQGDRDQQRQALAKALPDNYEAGTPEQQMAMTLLAAREILEALTLTVSTQKPTCERHWRTTAGLVWLRLNYSVEPDQDERKPLKISVRLPKGGKLWVTTDRETVQAERIYPGFLSVELFDWQPGEHYSVAVSLQNRQCEPLQFIAICQ